jgi:hypothetical protein
MAETVTIDRLSVAKPVPRPRSAKPATVSASALALRLDCSRTCIAKLEGEGVIQRQDDGFLLDRSRVAYLRQCEHWRSPPTADADHVKVKTETLQMRLMEKRRELVRRDEVNELIDAMCGTVLTHLSGMPVLARHGGEAQHRRGGDADQARDQRGVQQGSRRTQRAAIG